METTVSYIAFNEIGVTIGVIVAAMTFIVLTWNAVKAIHDWRESAKKPTEDRLKEDESRIEDHEERITTLEQCCEDVHGKLDSDAKFRQDNIEMNRLLLESIDQLLKHALDGNDTDGLKNVQTKVTNYLYEHAQ